MLTGPIFSAYTLRVSSQNRADMQAEEAERNHFLDRSQLTRRWQCSLAHLRRMEATGELRPTRLGARMVRYAANHIAEIEAAATAGTVKLDNK